jgi:hypothetical protein
VGSPKRYVCKVATLRVGVSASEPPVLVGKRVECPQEDKPVKLRTTLILPYPWRDFLNVCSQYVWLESFQ